MALVVLTIHLMTCSIHGVCVSWKLIRKAQTLLDGTCKDIINISKDCAFVKAPIGNIDILDMEDELNRVISKHNLIQKEWINAKVILNKTFRYAKRRN